MMSVRCPKCGNTDILVEEDGYWGKFYKVHKLRARCWKCGEKFLIKVEVKEVVREPWTYLWR